MTPSNLLRVLRRGIRGEEWEGDGPYTDWLGPYTDTEGIPWDYWEGDNSEDEARVLSKHTGHYNYIDTGYVPRRKGAYKDQDTVAKIRTIVGKKVGGYLDWDYWYGDYSDSHDWSGDTWYLDSYTNRFITNGRKNLEALVERLLRRK